MWCKGSFILVLLCQDKRISKEDKRTEKNINKYVV